MKKEPWVVVFEPKWPFSFHIACGDERLVEFRRVAYSTKANDLDDMRRAVGFAHAEREKIAAMVAEQEALAQSICDAMNSQESLRSDLAAMREALVDAAANLLWQRDYPQGGTLYRTYESIPFHDKELYRAEVLAAFAWVQS